MDCLNYPFESATLLAKKIRLKKQLKAETVNPVHKRIAVLGGSTTNEVVDQLELFLLNQGISAEFYQSEYAQYWEDAVFGNETLDNFKPDIIYIHTTWRNINAFPSVGDTADKIEDVLNEEYNRFVTMWDALEQKFHCPIIQNNFDRPNYRLLDNM